MAGDGRRPGQRQATAAGGCGSGRKRLRPVPAGHRPPHPLLRPSASASALAAAAAASKTAAATAAALVAALPAAAAVSAAARRRWRRSAALAAGVGGGRRSGRTPLPLPVCAGGRASPGVGTAAAATASGPVAAADGCGGGGRPRRQTAGGTEVPATVRWALRLTGTRQRSSTGSLVQGEYSDLPCTATSSYPA